MDKKASAARAFWSRTTAAALVSGIGLSAAQALQALPENGPGWTFFLINAVITVLAIAFAIGVTTLMLHRGANHRKIVARLRGRLSEKEGKLFWTQSILAVDPQVVLVWDGSEKAPIPLEDDFAADLAEDLEEEVPLLMGPPQPDQQMSEQPFSPLGKPKILGSARAVSSVLGVGAIEPGTRSGKKGDVSIFDIFLAGLQRADKSRLVSAIQTLKMEGQRFVLEASAQNGRSFRAEGLPAGGKAVVWLRDISHEDQSVRDLARERDVVAEEKDQFVELLDHAPFPVWRRDRALALQWANRAYVRAVDEASLEAVLAKGAELDAADRKLALEAIQSLDTVSERRYVVSGGKRRYLEIKEVPVKDGTMGVAIDMTNLDEAQNMLQRHIDAHAETLNSLATAVAIFGADKKLAYYNQAYVDLMGLSDDWLDQAPLESEVLERLRDKRRLPEQADFPAWKRGRLELYANLLAEQEEMWHLPDNSTLRVVVRPHPLGGLIHLYEDVTDHVTLESSYNQLISVQSETLDNLSEGVAVFGTDGRLKLHNAAFARIWNLDQGSLTGEPDLDDISRACAPLVESTDQWSGLRKRITSGDSERKSFSDQMDRTDGTIIAYGAVPLPDGATLTSFLDITDSMQIERALRDRNEALEAADRIKSEFVNHVSYQLRTPLNSIIGFSEMIDQQIFGALNDKQKEYTGNILEASGELLSLIDDILDLATIDAGGMVLDVEEIGLRDVMESALRLVHKKAHDAGITLKLDCPKDLPPIHADERRLKQILFNLLSNAIAFTPQGGSITLGARRVGAEARIWVADTGSGIEAKFQPSVFDRFENRGGQGNRGAGLGLSLVKSFVELHGGWVSLASEEGKGTTVTCHLIERANFGTEAAE
ncbi:MAG: PAS domain-containing sensor histidine kinase [Alphaproteobacteria bacterium]|nr:MAG: PAS domain-containing sensor histidine kinase [Alphaproteobacteria bacterium]